MSKTRAAVAGTAMTPVTRTLTKSVRETAFDMVEQALADAGLRKDDVDSLFVTPPWFTATPNFMWCAALAEYLGVRVNNLSTVENGGHTAALTFKYALNEVLLGRSKCAVALAIEKCEEEDWSNPQIFLHSAAQMLMALYGPYQGLYGIGAPIPLYAMSAQRYLHEHKLTREDVAEVAVLLRKHAAENPMAMFRKKPITVQDVIAAEPLSPPIGMLDCTRFAAGAACAVLVREEDAKGLRHPRVVVSGIGERHEPSHFNDLRGSLSEFPATREAARQAFKEAGRTPEQVQVATAHGVFSFHELMAYEDLGFFPKGRAPHAVKEGMTTYGGKVVFAPDGGRLSLGYPACVAPLQMVYEIQRQLQGRCGPRQVKDAHVGLVHAEHGMFNGGFVAILERND